MAEDVLAAAGEVLSDGYHTFDQLYAHRHRLFVALCRQLAARPLKPRDLLWRSRQHGDGSSYPDWFIMGIWREPGQQITYHLPLSLWDETDFVETLDRAPEFDGHTSDDVLARLRELGV